MSFLNEYATAIITVSLLSVLLETLLPPGGNKKYITMLIGLFVMLIILKPLTGLPYFSDTFALPQQRLTDKDMTIPARPYVAEIFEKKLALTFCEDIKNTFNTVIECRISCRLNDEGQITGIRHVQLSPYRKDFTAYLSEKYGIEEALMQP